MVDECPAFSCGSGGCCVAGNWIYVFRSSTIYVSYFIVNQRWDVGSVANRGRKFFLSVVTFEAVIIDLGFASTMTVTPGASNLIVGTLPYLSPEIVEGRPHSSFCADIWALGVMLFVLLCGNFPFAVDLYSETNWELVVPRTLGKHPTRILQKMLCQMEDRATVEALLRDKWIASRQSPGCDHEKCKLPDQRS